MLTSSSQPGMFPVVSIHSPISLAHTLPPPGSSTVSVQQQITLPTTSVTLISDLSDATVTNPTDIVMVDNKKQVYMCSYCNKSFGSRYNLNRHEKSCKMADCKMEDDVNVMVTDPSQDISKRVVQCPQCNKGFTSQQGVNRHLKKCKAMMQYTTTTVRSSPSSKKVHLCRYCAKQFSTKWNAIRHENLFHSADDPIITDSVTAVMPYVPQEVGKPERYCRFCGNYFSTKYNAIRHERICTRVKSTGTENVNLMQPQNTVINNVTNMVDNNNLDGVKATVLQVMTPTPQTISEMQELANQQHQQQVNVQQQQPQQQTVQQIQVSTQSVPTLQGIQQHQQTVQQQQQQRQQQQTVQQTHNQQQTVQQAISQQQNVQQQQQSVQQHIIQQQNHQLQNVIQQQTQPQQTIQNHHQILHSPQTQQIHLQSLHPQHAVVCQSINPVQGQQLQLNTQQVVFVNPFHVCKFCGKQFDTKCESTLLQESIQAGQLQTQTAQAIFTAPNVPIMAFQAPSLQQTFQTQQIQQQNQQVDTTQQQTVQQQPTVQAVQQQQQQTVQAVQQQTVQQDQAIVSEQQKPHGCRYCNKHFATKWYLDQHEKVHTGQAVTCKACNKSFVTRWHMEKHMRVHNNVAGKKKKDEQDSIGVQAEVPQSGTQYVSNTDYTHFTLNTSGAAQLHSDTLNNRVNQQIHTESLNVNRSQSPQQTIVTVPLSFAEGTQFVTISSSNTDNTEK